MAHKRIQIHLNDPNEVKEFVSILNDVDVMNEYFLEDISGILQVDAKSILGATYASIGFNGGLYLVNNSVDGAFPKELDQFKL